MDKEISTSRTLDLHWLADMYSCLGLSRISACLVDVYGSSYDFYDHFSIFIGYLYLSVKSLIITGDLSVIQRHARCPVGLTGWSGRVVVARVRSSQ